jgi:serine protease SohB
MLYRSLPWRRPRINVVELHGILAPRPGSLSARVVTPLVDRAFATARGQPVILDIESPGGSPVQSDLIASLIRRRADSTLRVRDDPRLAPRAAIGWHAADEIHANR